MLVFCAGQNGSASSPSRQCVGMWTPRNQLAVTLDVTLYQIQAGDENYNPPPPGSLIGAAINDRSTSSTLATIAAYDHPVTSPGTLQPIAWCDPVPGMAQLFRAFSVALPQGQVADGLDVTVLFGSQQDGQIAGQINDTDYPLQQPHSVSAFKVIIPGSMVNSVQQGAPVVLANDPTTLVGFVLTAALRPDGSTLLECYPAFLF